ncbi:MAG: putative membrane protein [Paraglaciecola psychrophila]|jgi:uncharacterized membrane protein
MSNRTPKQNGYLLSPADQRAKSHAFIAYCLMAVGLFTGFFWLVGALWAMGKRSAASDTVFAGHYDAIISMFWWGLGLSILGAILSVIVIGYLLIFAVWLWSLYKIVTGIAKLSSNEAIHSN